MTTCEKQKWLPQQDTRLQQNNKSKSKECPSMGWKNIEGNKETRDRQKVTLQFLEPPGG